MKSLIRRYEAGVVGLPADGKFFAFSNSEASYLSCPRKFLLGQIDGLKPRASKVMDQGNAWDLVITDVYTWWMERDRKYPVAGLDRCVWCNGKGSIQPAVASTCEHCGGEGDSVIERAMQPYRDQYEIDMASDREFPAYSLEELEKIEDTVRRMLDGYLIRYQGGPLQSMKIIAVQPALARQIFNPRTKKPFRPQMLMERFTGSAGLGLPGLPGTGEELRIAGTRASRPGADLLKVSWPWFIIGRLDALAADRRTNMGCVIDAKASGQPSRYHDSIQHDPQLPGYCWLVDGHLDHFKLSGVYGFMYDVVHSKYQPDPEELVWKAPKVEDMKAQCVAQGIETKGLKTSADYQAVLGIEPGHGGFSRNTRASVPSWRYERAIKAAGLEVRDYEDHLQMLSEVVDPTLYRRDPLPFSAERRADCGVELFGKAARIHILRKAAAMAKDEIDIGTTFHREPICTGPGARCPFAGPCANDSAEARQGYDIVTSQRWGENLRADVKLEQQEVDETGADAFDW